MAAICRARLLSDPSASTPCDQKATSLDGRFCGFHSCQCQALYRGYKRRNEELDQLAVPPYLSATKTSLVRLEFKDVTDEATCHTIYQHLFRKYNLLDRVIRARKLHHSHFFAVDNDYGHEKYLSKLQNDRQVVAKALERLGTRGADIMYERKNWFDWVKQRQDDDQVLQENESKKIKLESLLFKRHQKEVDRHQQNLKAKEQKQLEEEFLDEAYHQRLAEMSDQEQDEWDPVHDVFGFERENYIDLINFFLMRKDHDTQEDTNRDAVSDSTKTVAETNQLEKAPSKSAKKRARKTNAEMRKLNDPSLNTPEGRGSGIIEMETKAQMRERLRQPVKYERNSGWYFSGTQHASSFDATSPPLPEDEIEQLLEEVAEVKHYLFCRLLLSHASLLPVALKAQSIEEFFSNEQITRETLRDLCLKLERPGLQDVRDACADFIRGEKEEEWLDNEKNVDDKEEDAEPWGRSVPEKYRLRVRSRERMPKQYRTKRENAAKKSGQATGPMMGAEEPDGILDFGEIKNENDDYSRKRMRIKICGRWMYNYPSEQALNRGGWFHFSLIAKDSDLSDAAELCRNWNEFFELNILCLYSYFPTAKWMRFVGDVTRQQLLHLGFVPYFVGNEAKRVTHHFQTGSRGMARRAHQVMEMRNFVCGHIKRDDAVSRRFIQYLSMQTYELRALVRDCKTGRMLIEPPEDELWLVREKSGWGRANKHEFNVISEVGPAFFEKMDQLRQWHLGFDEVYDVYIWDSTPGRRFVNLQRQIEELMARAIRVHNFKDMFSVVAPIMKTITKDPESERVRSLKPNDEAQSMWDDLGVNIHILQWSSDTREMTDELDDSYKYNEADELEDAILFPQEATGAMADNLFRAMPSAMDMFEKQPIVDLRRFAHDLDTDEEVSSEADFEVEEDDGDSDWDTEKEWSEDKDFEYVTAHEAEMDGTIAINFLSDRFKSMMYSRTRDPDYFLPIVRNPAAANQIPRSVRQNPADLMAAMRLSLRRQKEYGDSHAFMEADLMGHIDREKSKVFKHVWHMADAEPGARARYLQWTLMMSKADDFVMSKLTPGPFELCKRMDMAELFTEDRRTVDDAFKAYAAIALFFETDAFHESEHGALFKDSKLFRQAERAREVPDRRSHMSNKTMPRAFWAEWEELLRANGRKENDAIEDIYPIEWRKAIRPIIIRLFRAGVICQSYAGMAAGVSIAGAEAGRSRDLYIDYRANIPLLHIVSHLKDPTPLDRSHILAKTGAFSRQHSAARFAVLRLWSAPHFYPLMLGYDKREMTTFLDDCGRCWEFKFIPKDMPYSEWSVHQQLSQRLEPCMSVFGSQVMVAKDMVVVMGKDEQDARRVCEGVTWAIQRKPWRLEVDFWRSFVNVDHQFLAEAQPKWLE